MFSASIMEMFMYKEVTSNDTIKMMGEVSLDYLC